jgi:hypothetical protein
MLAYLEQSGGDGEEGWLRVSGKVRDTDYTQPLMQGILGARHVSALVILGSKESQRLVTPFQGSGKMQKETASRVIILFFLPTYTHLSRSRAPQESNYTATVPN